LLQKKFGLHMSVEKLLRNGPCLMIVGLGLLLVAGCGGGSRGPKTVNVSGTVYLDGQPVEGVEIEFHGQDFVGIGMTNAQGAYTLVTGCVPGENTVLFRKQDIGGFQLDPESGMDMGQLEAMAAAQGQGAGVSVQVKGLIPEFYSDIQRTNIKYNVPDGGTDSADFRLDSSAK
jgi:hypothetical protein